MIPTPFPIDSDAKASSFTLLSSIASPSIQDLIIISSFLVLSLFFSSIFISSFSSIPKKKVITAVIVNASVIPIIYKCFS
jgi:hypothetical protein